MTGLGFGVGALNPSSSVLTLAAPNLSGRSSPISIKLPASILLTSFPGTGGRLAPIVTGGMSLGLAGA